MGLPCGSAGKESACSVGDLSSIPELGRSPGEGKGYPLQYSGLKSSIDCIVHGVTKSWTWLSNFHFLLSYLESFFLMCVYIDSWFVVTSSVQSLSRVRLFATHESQHARPPCPSPTPAVHSNSCTSSWWCHPAISSSVVPFSSCPQSLPASGSCLMSQLFARGGQSIGVSALASVLLMNTQDWSPLERTGWMSLQSKGLSRVFSNTTV